MTTRTASQSDYDRFGLADAANVLTLLGGLVGVAGLTIVMTVIGGVFAVCVYGPAMLVVFRRGS